MSGHGLPHHVGDPGAVAGGLTGRKNALVQYFVIFNPLALELDIYSLTHHLCKM